MTRPVELESAPDSESGARLLPDERETPYWPAPTYYLTDRNGLLLSAGYVEVPWEEVLL